MLKGPTQQTNFIACAVEDAQSGGCQLVYVVVGDVGAEGRTADYALARECEQDYVVQAACDEAVLVQGRDAYAVHVERY